MSETDPPPPLLQLTTEIVAAHASHNKLSPEALLQLIESVYSALAGSGRPAATEAKPEPAVPVKRSVFPDHLVCLEDGKKLKMLKRHLMASYNLTPEQYPEEMGPAGELSNGGTGVCCAALGAGEGDRARPEAGREAAGPDPPRPTTGTDGNPIGIDLRRGSRFPYHGAIRRYGWDSLKFSVLARFAAEAEAKAAERRPIAEKRAQNRRIGYNVADGGDGIGSEGGQGGPPAGGVPRGAAGEHAGSPCEGAGDQARDWSQSACGGKGGGDQACSRVG